MKKNLVTSKLLRIATETRNDVCFRVMNSWLKEFLVVAA